MKTWTLVAVLASALWMPTTAEAQESRLSASVNTNRAYRHAIRSMHILDRPYRPGHFYGNTVRRRHYGGTPQRARLFGR